MKAKLKQTAVNCWDCGNPNHRHRTETVAQSCIDKREKAAKYNASARRWTKEEHAKILEQWRSGVKKSEIARQQGLSPERIRCVISKALILEKKAANPNPLDGLSWAATCILNSAGLKTESEVRGALLKGSIDHLQGMNAYTKTHIKRWLSRQEVTASKNSNIQ